MRVLVTGGSGYIGSATVRELVQHDHSVVIYDNLSTGHRKLSKGFELIEGDIADRSKILPALKRVDAIIHFAASAYVGESVADPRKYFRNNVESALALMDCVLETDVRILYQVVVDLEGLAEQLAASQVGQRFLIDLHSRLRQYPEQGTDAGQERTFILQPRRAREVGALLRGLAARTRYGKAGFMQVASIQFADPVIR